MGGDTVGVGRLWFFDSVTCGVNSAVALGIMTLCLVQASTSNEGMAAESSGSKKQAWNRC